MYVTRIDSQQVVIGIQSVENTETGIDLITRLRILTIEYQHWMSAIDSN